MNIITTNALINCPHGGIVRQSTLQSKVYIQGFAVLINGDTAFKPIAGCPNVGPTIKPCTLTLSVEDGISSKVFIHGTPVMLTPATGGCDGTPPMATKYTVASPGQLLVSSGS